MLSLAHIHPILVHFPIVFFLTLAAIDICRQSQRIDDHRENGNLSTGLAGAAGLFAVVTPSSAMRRSKSPRMAAFTATFAEIHEGLGGAPAASMRAGSRRGVNQ
jgi:uncharacterized membrane protein